MAVSPREHHGVGAVECGVGHIAGFGPSGEFAVGHAVEHLSGSDHRHAMGVGHADDLFLQDRHGRQIDFDPEVASSHHHRIGDVDDGFEIGDGFTLFDFRDDVWLVVTGVTRDEISEPPDVVAVADEAESDEVDFSIESPGQVLTILVRHTRSTQSHTRQVHTLSAADGAGSHDLADDPIVLFGGHDQFDDPIGEQDAITGLDIVDQWCVGAGEFLHRVRAVVTGPIDFVFGISVRVVFDKDDGGAFLAQQLSRVDFSESDFGAGQVAEDSDGSIEFHFDLSDGRQGLIVPVVGAVCEVEPKDIDSGEHQVAECFEVGAGRSDCGDDLGLDHRRLDWHRGMGHERRVLGGCIS